MKKKDDKKRIFSKCSYGIVVRVLKVLVPYKYILILRVK